MCEPAINTATPDDPDDAVRADLGPAGRALWEGVVADLADDDLELDNRERALIHEAALHLDLAARLEAELAEAARHPCAPVTRSQVPGRSSFPARSGNASPPGPRGCVRDRHH